MRQYDRLIRRIPDGCRTLCWALLGAAFLASGWDCAAADDREDSRAVLIRFEGPITPRLEQYTYRKLDEARQQNVDLVIVEIDSPGGYVEESLRIAERLRDIDWARTVAFVPEEAISGAAFVALGCDEIVMNRNAQMGDAGPIYADEGFAFRHAPEKYRSYLSSKVRGLAEAKGRPPALAEAMVDMDLVVYRVKNSETDEETFKSEAEIESEENPELWEKVNPVHESREKQFLQVTGSRAVELGLADGNAVDRQQLKERYGVSGELLVLEPSGVDTAVYVLNLPVVTGLLFVIGLVALYVEFSAPGIGVGGLISLLCFTLFFWSRLLGGTAGWLEVILFVAGVAFLLVEVFVLPGFGVAGLSGILMLLVSLVLACQRHLVPKTPADWDTLTATLLTIMASGIAFALAAFVLSRHFGTLPILSRLTLAPPQSAEAVVEATETQAALEVGAVGVAASALRPAGKAHFGNHYVDVVTDSEFITKGQRVKILQIHGNRIVVTEAKE